MRLAESESAPCSPCKMLDRTKARILVREANLLTLVELVCNGGVQLDAKISWHDHLLREIHRIGIEVDVSAHPSGPKNDRRWTR